MTTGHTLKVVLGGEGVNWYEKKFLISSVEDELSNRVWSGL